MFVNLIHWSGTSEMPLLIRKTSRAVSTTAECLRMPGLIKESFCFHSVIICIIFHTKDNATTTRGGAVGLASYISITKLADRKRKPTVAR